MAADDSTAKPIRLERDRRLAAQILAGDERALREFMREYFPRLYRYCRHRLSNEADIDDVVQRTLTQAARRLETYRGESTLLTWLVHICRHEISRQLRETRASADMMQAFLSDEVLRSVLESAAIDESEEPEALHSRAELITLIQFALDQLPERHAQALEWKYVEGLSTREIAGQLKISDEAVQSLLARSRRAFREIAGSALAAAL